MELERTTLWAETYAGKKLYLPVTEEMLDIRDISHALSMQCRYAGHVNRFYSVAEHSCYIADYVWEQTGNKRHALEGLLHDASETYLVDVPKPIKKFLANYHELEIQVEQTIAQHWGLDYPWSDLIKTADCRILIDERKELFTWSGHDWELPVSEPLGVTIEALPPILAKQRFMHRYNKYAT